MPDERLGPEAGYGVASEAQEQALGGAEVTYVDGATPPPGDDEGSEAQEHRRAGPASSPADADADEGEREGAWGEGERGVARGEGPDDDEPGAMHESRLEEGGGHGRLEAPDDAPYFPAEGGQWE